MIDQTASLKPALSNVQVHLSLTGHYSLQYRGVGVGVASLSVPANADFRNGTTCWFS